MQARSGDRRAIPARKDLEIYKDVVGLAAGGLLSFQPVPTPSPGAPTVPVHRPERIRKREEARQRTLADPLALLPLMSELQAILPTFYRRVRDLQVEPKPPDVTPSNFQTRH